MIILIIKVYVLIGLLFFTREVIETLPYLPKQGEPDNGVRISMIFLLIVIPLWPLFIVRNT